MKQRPDQSAQQAKSQQALFTVAAAIAVVAVGLAAYANSLEVPFVFDDQFNIKRVPNVRVTELSWDQLSRSACLGSSPRRAVARISFGINYYFHKYDVWGYHAVNIAIHVLNAVLVYLIGLATFPRAFASQHESESRQANSLILWMSLCSALLFVSHPLQTQAVTYIVQRMASLATFFYLVALLLYIHGRSTESTWRRWVMWSCTAAAGLLAVGCKEIAVTLPMTIFLYEWYFFQDLSFDWLKRCLKYLVPVCALMILLTILLQGSSVTDYIQQGYAQREFTLGERLLTQPRVVMFCLSLFVWPLPSRMSITHDFSVSHGVFDPVSTLLSLLVLVGLLTVAVLTARRYRMLSFGIVWVILHLAIESTILPLELVYEHRMYLPMVGLLLAVAWGLFAVLPHVNSAIAIVVLVTLVLAATTHVRNHDWQDAQTLWTDVVAKYPQDPRPHNNLGLAHFAEGELPQAAEQYRQALQKKPEYPEAQNNLGIVLAAQGDVQQAIKHYRLALQHRPGYSDAHFNLGIALVSLGSTAEGIENYRRAIESRPESAAAHTNLANALASQGKYPAAKEHYRQAIQHDPGLADAYGNYGSMLMLEGKLDEAADLFQKALKIRPTYLIAHLNLADVLAAQGMRSEAVRHYRRALELAIAQGNQRLADEISVQLRSFEISPPAQ